MSQSLSKGTFSIMDETITMAEILLIPEFWVTAEIAIKDETLYR